MNVIELFHYEIVDIKPSYSGEPLCSSIYRFLEGKGLKTKGSIIKKPTGILHLKRIPSDHKYIIYQEET